MSTFLYFIPGAPRDPSVTIIQGYGLSYALTSQSFLSVQQNGGPAGGGVQGFMYAMKEYGCDAFDLKYEPDAQTWRQIPKTDAWVGFWNDRPPTPTDLVRDEALAGFWVDLDDGNSWLCPVARKFDTGECSLQAKIEVDQVSGAWISGALSEKNAILFETACAFHVGVKAIKDDGVVSFEFEGTLLDAALLALSTNYRLGKVEVVMLGLFGTEETAQQILLALAGYSVSKKKLMRIMHETSITSDGVED